MWCCTLYLSIITGGTSGKKLVKMDKKKLSVGAVIREPGSTATSNMSGWRSKMPIIDSKKAKDKCLERAWLTCPDGAIFRDASGKFKVNYKYCKGCGICAEVCPKCIKMAEVKK